MNEIKSKILFGNQLPECQYEGVNFPYISFPGSGYYKGLEYPNKTFSIDKDSIYQHVLLLGGSGSGKTNVIRQIVKQSIKNSRSDCIRIIFDTKADYINTSGFFHEGDYILGSSAKFRDKSCTWNIFDEIMADGNNKDDLEANTREIASVLFKDRVSESQPFFANAARDLLAGTILFFIRRSHESPERWTENLNNYRLFNFIMNVTPAKLSEQFSKYEDLRGLRTYFGDGKNEQALGVFAELHSLMYDCFQGIFRKAPTQEQPSFSIRKAIRNKGNHNIFIEYDMSRGESLVPIYRLLIDLALKEALSENSSGNTALFLDELKLLPKVTHLEDALNYGRSKRVSVIAGLQSVSQIYSIYGQEQGQVILGGFGSIIALKTNDSESREFVTRRFAPNISAYRYDSGNGKYVDRERNGNTVEHWEQMNLSVGQAIIGLSTQATPFLFKFLYEE